MKTGTSVDEIYLVNYTQKGKISSPEEISTLIKELFSPESHTVHYSDKDNFEIIPLKTVLPNNELPKNYEPFKDLIAYLQTSIQVGMELIELA